MYSENNIFYKFKDDSNKYYSMAKYLFEISDNNDFFVYHKIKKDANEYFKIDKQEKHINMYKVRENYILYKYKLPSLDKMFINIKPNINKSHKTYLYENYIKEVIYEKGQYLMTKITNKNDDSYVKINTNSNGNIDKIEYRTKNNSYGRKNNKPALLEYFPNCKFKTIGYYNFENNLIHRDDNNKPAFITFYPSGNIRKLLYYKNGIPFHFEQPSEIQFYDDKDNSVKLKIYQIKENIYHREDNKPAVIKYYPISDGGGIEEEFYYYENNLTRDNGLPAIIKYNQDGLPINMEYIINGVHKNISSELPIKIEINYEEDNVIYKYKGNREIVPLDTDLEIFKRLYLDLLNKLKYFVSDNYEDRKLLNEKLTLKNSKLLTHDELSVFIKLVNKYLDEQDRYELNTYIKNKRMFNRLLKKIN